MRSKTNLSLIKETNLINKYNSIKTLVEYNLSSNEVIFFIIFLKYEKESRNSLYNSSICSFLIDSSFESLLLNYVLKFK